MPVACERPTIRGGRRQSSARTFYREIQRTGAARSASSIARRAGCTTRCSATGGAPTCAWARAPAPALALTRMNADIDVRHVLPSVRVPTLVAAPRRRPVPGRRRRTLSREPHPRRALRRAAGRGSPAVRRRSGRDARRDRGLSHRLTAWRRRGSRTRPGHGDAAASVDDDPVRFDASVPRWTAFAAREIERFRGRVRRSGGTLAASFDGPARAVRCAALLAEAARRVGLCVRVGVHTGECDLSTEELTGPAVDVASARRRTRAALRRRGLQDRARSGGGLGPFACDRAPVEQ